jgi:hypothetical protein
VVTYYAGLNSLSYIEMSGKYKMLCRFNKFCGKKILFQNLPFSMSNV